MKLVTNKVRQSVSKKKWRSCGSFHQLKLSFDIRLLDCSLKHVSAPALTTGPSFRGPPGLGLSGICSFRKKNNKYRQYIYISNSHFKDENQESNVAKLCGVCKCRVVAMYVRIALCCRRVSPPLRRQRTRATPFKSRVNLGV